MVGRTGRGKGAKSNSPQTTTRPERAPLSSWTKRQDLSYAIYETLRRCKDEKNEQLCWDRRRGARGGGRRRRQRHAGFEATGLRDAHR